MRLASSHRLSQIATLAALCASSSFAVPTISDWKFASEGTRETIELRWTESIPVELNQFAQAKQVTAVLPGALLREGTPTRLLTSGSRVLDRARLQEVVLPNGQKGVQLMLQLSSWTEVETSSSPTGLVISLHVPAELRPVAAVASEQGLGLELTDEKIATLGTREFGSADAPVAGAGQAPDAAASITDYYVPPPVERKRSAAGNEEIGDASVENKLNEFVKRVDFQGTSLENVLRLIAEEAELNLLIQPSDVAGRNVTLRLRNVTLRQMLDAILKANNLGYTIEEGGIVRVVPREQVKSTGKETVIETIPINWVDAADVKNALEPLVDKEDGSIEVLASNNILIVRDVPENVQKMQQLVDLLDVPEKQVLIEMRLVNMSQTARRAIGTRTGVETQSTENRFLRDPEGNFFDQRDFVNSTTGLNNTITDQSSRTGNSNMTSTATDVVGAITNPTSALTNGLQNNNTLTRNNSTTFNSTSSAVPTSRVGAGLLAPSANAFTLSTLFSANVLGTQYDVDMAINAEENRGEAVTLAAPQVLSLNNKEATVEIKRQIPYVSAVNSDQGSVATVEFIDVGTTVILLPRITNNGYVQMEIAPEQIIDTGERPGGVPLTDERRVTSSVIVRDEQTIALGGLREFSATSGENGVPYLLRVPILGWLFRNEENRQAKTELYLFVTPQIVKDPTPSAYQTSLYEKIDYNWDLPDYFYDEVFARKAPNEDLGPAKR